MWRTQARQVTIYLTTDEATADTSQCVIMCALVLAYIISILMLHLEAGC